jgi:hypothetical protein
MEDWLATSPWYGVVLWIILYTSDYYFTLYSARGLREVGHFQHEGGYELTPQFQKDVDSLRPVSPLHLALLFLYSLLLLLVWWFVEHFQGMPGVYLFYLGMFLLLEAAVHFRHLRNAFLVHALRQNGGVEGRILYRRWLSYRISAFDFLVNSGFFLIVSILEWSPFFLGGAVMCLVMTIRHAGMAAKAKSTSATPADAL